MIVFCTLKETESQKSVSAESVLGKHTLNGKLHSLGGLCCHKSIVACFFKMADIAGVALPFLLSELVACQNSVFAVDDTAA